jgi:hypothetical protein
MFDNFDDIEEYNEIDGFNGNVFFEDRSIFEEEEYQKEEDHQNCNSYVEQKKFPFETLKPEDYKLKNKTEIDKNQIKTKNTETFLEKKTKNKDNLEEFNEKEKIFKITKDKKKGNKKGRKKKFDMTYKKHNKFTPDNIARKILAYVFEVLLRYINSSIIENPNENSEGIIVQKPILLKINQETILDINKDKVIELLHSPLKEIFSRNISKKLTKYYAIDENKKTIEDIFKDNEQKRAKEILNMTFLQSLEHLRGSHYYSELAGLEKQFKNIIIDLENKGESDDYIKVFIDSVNTFETDYENKISRKRKSNNNSENNLEINAIPYYF